ncbi:hypothetical protein ACP_0614 [Acidobacterium capsulatum ATCC 51196]|uniref:Uncharacterized protein n=1 Tax=Acidobacterium capsulatum (strain ATCC 51196 / DSM 11244 / BCRC 80197 / JCM 7670 / NBRC 15755 / NCIMB 13165 / 161) TaxID=240015 RepID=C1F1L3_ACIC5|nr:hypothetical protein ACP_0614 [Acidobacterium capsulatum ATCC 51196]
MQIILCVKGTGFSPSFSVRLKDPALAAEAHALVCGRFSAARLRAA